MTVHEVQHTVVRAAEVEAGQHVVGIAGEVPVGEEQQFDDVPKGLGRLPRQGGLRRLTVRPAGNIYVSHVDIFLFYCYPNARFRERIVPAGFELSDS